MTDPTETYEKERAQIMRQMDEIEMVLLTTQSNTPEIALLCEDYRELEHKLDDLETARIARYVE